MPPELDDLGNPIVEPNTPLTEEGKVDYKAKWEAAAAQLKEQQDAGSKLGRKVKDQDARMEQMNKNFEDRLNNVQQDIIDRQKQAFGGGDDEDEDAKMERYVSDIASKQAKKMYDEEVKKNQEMQDKYMNDYNQMVQSMGEDLTPDEYEAICIEMEGMKGYSFSGADDAQKNFNTAYISILKNGGKSAKTNTSFRSEPNKGTHNSSSTQQTVRDASEAGVTKAKNDPAAAHYLNYRATRRNKTDNDAFVKRALQNSVNQRV